MKECVFRYLKEHKFVLGMLLLFLIWTIVIFSDLKHIPGPIYGGDLYREKGYVEHILRGGWFFTDPTINGEFTYFPWFATLFTAIVAFVTQFPLHKILIFLPVVLVAVRGLAYYHLGLSIFKEKHYAIILVAFALMWSPFDTKISTNIAHLCAVLALVFLFEYIQRPTLKYAITSGIFYGLVSLSHGQVFLSYSAMLFFGLLLFTAKTLYLDKQKPLAFFKEFRFILVLYAIAVLISLAFFGPLIVKYRLHQDNPVANYALNDVSDLGLLFPIKGLLSYFTPRVSLRGVIALFMILGFIYSVLNIHKRAFALAIFLLVGVNIGVSHYIFTIPLFDTWFEPWKLTDQYLTIFAILGAIGVKHVLTLFPKIPHLKEGLTLGCILLCASIINSHSEALTNDQWFKYGAQFDGHTKALYEMGDWIKKNTDPKDVFLANDESAFALNAMAGAKVVFLRRVHASYFIGIDKRYADGIVMLYGNNPETQRNLLRTYGVKYFLVDQFLMNYPMIVKEEYAEYLSQNGIVFSREKVRFDPSTTTAPQFDALVVPPQNLSLEPFLTPMQAFSIDSQPIALIYAVQQ